MLCYKIYAFLLSWVPSSWPRSMLWNGRSIAVHPGKNAIIGNWEIIVKDSCSNWEAHVSQSRTALKYKIMATYPELPLAWTYCLKFSHQLQSRRSSWKMCLPIIFLGDLADLVKDLDYRDHFTEAPKITQRLICGCKWSFLVHISITIIIDENVSKTLMGPFY